MDKSFVWIGGSTHIPFEQILAITDYDEPQAKKIIKEARESQLLWDFSRGKAKRTVVARQDGIVIVTGAEPQEIINTFEERE